MATNFKFLVATPNIGALMATEIVKFPELVEISDKVIKGRIVAPRGAIFSAMINDIRMIVSFPFSFFGGNNSRENERKSRHG